MLISAKIRREERGDTGGDRRGKRHGGTKKQLKTMKEEERNPTGCEAGNSQRDDREQEQRAVSRKKTQTCNHTTHTHIRHI
jgi:hypothetical protein